jgi:glutamine synthetase
MNDMDTRSNSDQDALLAEYLAFRERYPTLKFVDVMLTDPNGVQRGKRVEVSELEAIYREGRPLPGTMIALDITGQDVDETELAWEDGDADRPARPIPGTLVPTPWTAEPGAQLLLSYFDIDGKPHRLDPRHRLAEVVKRLDADGLHPVGAVELEFYLVDGAAWREGRLALASGHDTGRQGYSMTELDEASPFLDEVYAACAAQGLPAMTAISEYGPGQFEITLHHRPDILRAVDDAILYKRTVKAVARKHGMEATFMAKPFAGESGSGMHLHLSMTDAEGQNIYEAEGGEALLRAAIGGMQKTMQESLLVFAPHANSYRRFQTMSYAPVAPTWGINNRTVAFRVPKGPKGSLRVEHRVAGADANPYLVMATILAAIHHGIRERLDPGPPVTGNGYDGNTDRFPPNWLDAIRAFEASSFMKETFGEYFVDIFSKIKLGEYRRFHSIVPALDLEWYFRNV